MEYVSPFCVVSRVSNWRGSARNREKHGVTFSPFLVHCLREGQGGERACEMESFHIATGENDLCPVLLVPSNRGKPSAPVHLHVEIPGELCSANKDIIEGRNRSDRSQIRADKGATCHLPARGIRIEGNGMSIQYSNSYALLPFSLSSSIPSSI